MTLTNMYVDRELKKDLENEVRSLKELLRDSKELNDGLIGEREDLRKSLQQWTITRLGEGDIDQAIAEELSALFSFDLEKEFSVSFTIEYNLGMMASSKEEIEGILADIEIPEIHALNGYYVDNEIISQVITEM